VHREKADCGAYHLTPVFHRETLRDRIKQRSTRDHELDHDDLAGFPLSTAEKFVFVLKNCRVDTGYLIVINILKQFVSCRTTAEIGHRFRRLAASRQWNSAAWFGLAESACHGACCDLIKSHVCYM
jgi:hypothetical protein